jgi:hypothetical protein
MKQKLTGLDRLNIPVILQKANIEGNETEIIAIRELKKEIVEMVNISADELNEYGIRPNLNGGIMWDVEKIKTEKEIDLKKSHTELLKQCRETLDNKRLVTEQLLDTCLKIKKMR